MSLTNKNFKIAYNNLLTSSNATVSSELTGFEFGNAIDNDRSTKWICEGAFVVDATNNKIYINDGSDKTATLSSGTYTRSELATEVQTQLNSVSSNWICVDNQAPTLLFGIANSGSVTLRFSETTNSAWDMLGYTETIDGTGTNFVANEVRIHTSEGFTVDFGEDYAIGFFAMIGPISENFILTSTAQITLMGNTINDFSSPPFSVVISSTNGGAFSAFDEVSYRYWKLEIIDRENPNGPEIYFSNVYLGSYLHFTDRNISSGFSDTLIDNSQAFQAQSGYLYFSEFPTNSNIGGVQIRQVNKTQAEQLRDFFRLVGIREPFFFVADPGLCVSNSLDELTFFVRNGSPLSLQHIKSDRYEASLNLVEVI